MFKPDEIWLTFYISLLIRLVHKPLIKQEDTSK